jgi:hypothetical protein
LTRAVDPAEGVRIVPIEAAPKIICVVIGAATLRAIGVNALFQNSVWWQRIVAHGLDHLACGVDGFAICEVGCAGLKLSDS